VALLSAGPPPPDPAELLSHERLRLAIESLAGASDLVVIDAPPVLPVADPIILAQAGRRDAAGGDGRLERPARVGRDPRPPAQGRRPR
jgi:Mrp family chromosome partitioning ATPase